MTSLAEAESKYAHVVQSAGGQIFGIEKAASVGRQEEKLKIGTPDGFVKIDVVLNQPNIGCDRSVAVGSGAFKTIGTSSGAKLGRRLRW